MHAVVEEFRDALAVGDAEANECEDAHLARQRMVVGRHLAVALLEEHVEALHKMGEQLQECLVEGFIHALALAVERRLPERVAQVVVLSGGNLSVDGLVDLLQLLDEGSITGSDGVKVDGSKALIIFTSNIGVKSAKELANPMGITENYEELKNKREESIMVKALKKRFSPEFLNRLDSVCYFNNLSREVLNSILQKEMNEMNKGIKNITHKEVELSEDVRNWMLDKVEIEHNGARPIIRLLEQEIEEEIANLVINESELLEKESDKLIAELENDKIVLR